MEQHLRAIIEKIQSMDMSQKIAAINEIKARLKDVSPFNENKVLTTNT